MCYSIDDSHFGPENVTLTEVDQGLKWFDQLLQKVEANKL